MVWVKMTYEEKRHLRDGCFFFLNKRKSPRFQCFLSISDFLKAGKADPVDKLKCVCSSKFSNMGELFYKKPPLTELVLYLNLM